MAYRALFDSHLEEASLKQSALKLIGFFAFAAVMLVADQALKHWVVTHMTLASQGGASIPLVPGWFALTYTQNFGSAWSMLWGQRFLLIAIAGGVALGIIIYAARLLGVPYALVHATLAGQTLSSQLVVKETALAGLALGTDPEKARARYGEPSKQQVEAEGEWWIYDAEGGPHLKLLFAGKPAKLAQVQAWPGSSAETASLMRVLDPAVRLTRKYGAPAKTLPLGATGAEVWVYPAADAAFVVTPPDDKDRRSVGAIVVGR
jgi:hypothetical protein